MKDRCTTIEQLRKEISINASEMQEITSKVASKIDPDIAIILDRLMQLNYYNVDAILEYLENNS